MDAFEILVLILSIVLAISLVLSIICLSLLIYILKSFKRIMKTAESVADNVESASEFFKNTTMSGAAVKLMSNVMNMFSSNKKEDK